MTKKCKECGGWGWSKTASVPTPCPTCNGTGKGADSTQDLIATHHERRRQSVAYRVATDPEAGVL